MPLENTDTTVLHDRRKYNQWVANETLEDFALRHTARRARRWSFARITNTALGTSSFLVLELLGATIALNYGVYHSLWAIGVVCSLLFLSGIPISYYATKYSVDIDLLTRGAGFGYLGSTISSLIYASFTFIFFALEAAIMASALELLLGLPLWLGYIVSVLLVIPLVTHGIAMISRFQLITQPLWLLLQLAPIIYLAQHPQGFFHQWFEYSGLNETNTNTTFNWLVFGSATTVLFALVAQIGEQVDFLRFLPEKKKNEKLKWWTSIIVAGPGWVFFGAIKLVLGTMLAFILISQGFSSDEAANPTLMYSEAFNYFVSSPSLAIVIAAGFVIVCQIKINVANAYAGSLAWSNFFSRLTHHHPGRVVWLIFNVTIALMLMELGVFRAIETVLHHYSTCVLAWFGSVVADLIINKPLRLSPRFIEFKRSNLYDINPVGVISTLLATLAGILSSIGLLGELASAMSGFIAFFIPFICVPLIAVLTRSRYYLINGEGSQEHANVIASTQKENIPCSVCENKFDVEDMSCCPSYGGNICSLCCALETRCGDQCRPEGHIFSQLKVFFKPILGRRLYTVFSGPLGHFLLIFITLFVVTLCVFYLPYLPLTGSETISAATLFSTLVTIFFLLLVILGVMVWLFVLAQKSTSMALQDTNLQTQKLKKEISAHKNTLQELERARRSADSSNIAKSKYVTSLSHELRTPLNVILGYAQILQNDSDVQSRHKESLAILHRNGEHLANMIEGLLEISKIEAGKLSLTNDQVRLDVLLDQLIKMFSQQAALKGIYFHQKIADTLPKSIRVDEKRLRQILINLLTNAIKFTESGGVDFTVTYRSHVARFIIKDTGYGIPKKMLKHIFTPFERGADSEARQIPGSGLGLAISRQLADMMGADIDVKSEEGVGSTFTLLLQAFSVPTDTNDNPFISRIAGYEGPKKRILVIDDNKDHRQLIIDLLSPLGFEVKQAENSDSGLAQSTEGVDLVLLDVRLGHESGWDVAKQLKKQTQRLPIVMISANARGFYNSGPDQPFHDDYLEKPIQIDALLAKIGKLIKLEWIHTKEGGQEVLNENLLGLSDGYKKEESDAFRIHRDSDNKPTINKATGHKLLQLAKIGNFNALSTELTDVYSRGEISEDMYSKLNGFINRFDFVSVEQNLQTIIYNSEH